MAFGTSSTKTTNNKSGAQKSRFIIQTIVAPTKKARKPRAKKDDGSKAKSDKKVVSGQNKPTHLFGSKEVTLTRPNKVIDVDEKHLQSLAVAEAPLKDLPPIKPEADSFYWAERSGRTEIVLTNHDGSRYYLHGIEHTEEYNPNLITFLAKVYPSVPIKK
jgi:hypothetical protein